MKQTSTALIEARLEYMAKRHPKLPSENIWLMVFGEMERLDEVKDYLAFGFNPEAPSSLQLINQDMQSRFGSELYVLFAQHGRNPHTLRDTKTLIHSLYNDLSKTDPSARFSLSDIGVGVHANMPMSWTKLRRMGALDWNKPCAQYKNFTLYPAELALIESNVSLAHRILEDGGKIQNSEVFSAMVQGFLKNTQSNAVVRHRVWTRLLAFDPNRCAKELDTFAKHNSWSHETRFAFEAKLLTPTPMTKKEKVKASYPANSTQAASVDKRRQYLVELLLKVGQWVALKEVFSSANPRHFDIAECIYEKEQCSLSVLNAENPLTSIVQHICSNRNGAALGFFLNKGLRGDQVVNTATGDTVLHLWLRGCYLHQPPTKDFMQNLGVVLKATNNVSAVNHNGETALFALIDSNHYGANAQPIIEKMVAKGLDLRIRNNKGQTASDVLFAKRSDTILGGFLRNMETTQGKNALLNVVQEVQEKETQVHSNKRRM